MNAALIAAMQFALSQARRNAQKKEATPPKAEPIKCVFCNKELAEKDAEWGYCKHTECK